MLGHGKIAETLVAFGHALGFQTIVNDALASAEAFPQADVRVIADPDYAKVECDAETYVVIATQHKSDYEALQRVLAQSPAYVGLVASRKRSALVLERLHEDGVPLEKLRRVAAPAGLDIGGETPQEIALSILSEIVQLVRGGASSGRSLMAVKGVRITDAGVEVPEGPLESAKYPSLSRARGALPRGRPRALPEPAQPRAAGGADRRGVSRESDLRRPGPGSRWRSRASASTRCRRARAAAASRSRRGA